MTTLCCLLIWLPALGGDPNYVVHPGDANAAPFQLLTPSVTLVNTSALGVGGWNFGVCHDPQRLVLEDVVQGVDLAGYMPEPSFEQVAVFPGEGWTTGVILSFMGTNPLPASAAFHLYDASYVALPTLGLTTLNLCSLGAGIPPGGELLLEDGSVATPSELPGQILVEEPQPDPNYTLRLTDLEGAGSGLNFSYPVLLDSGSGGDVLGWSFNVCNDPVALQPVDVLLGADAATANNGLPPDFFALEISASAVAAAVLLGLGPAAPPVLPAANGLELHHIVYTELDIDMSTEVSFCATLLPDLAPMVIASDATPILPTTESGNVTPGTGVLHFIRGDCDGNGILNGATDAVYLFAWGFVPGSPEPVCLESGDVNDDGVLNPLSDGLALLQCSFVPGSPCPSAPYPNCGPDPSPADSVGCAPNGCP